MEFRLKVWRLSPQSIRLEKANKSLLGLANKDAVKFCGPYASANKYGFWVYPPVDFDLFYSNNKLEYRLLEEWSTHEVPIMKTLMKEDDAQTSSDFVKNFGGRMKIDCGRVEQNICQIWTGAAFKTPPEWGLLIRSPININMDHDYRIQEGILETDWLRYDIWINIAVQKKNTLIQIRKDRILAQLIPVHRNAYDQEWELSQEMINRDSSEADQAYRDWTDYNYKKWIKFIAKKPKDSSTYHKERSRLLGKTKVPMVSSPKVIPKKLLIKKKESGSNIDT